MKAQLTPTSNFILPLLRSLERVGGSGKKLTYTGCLKRKWTCRQPIWKCGMDIPGIIVH